MIDLAEARAKRRVTAYQHKIARVLESNRRAISRLFTTGAIFTRQGIRVGRDLLLAHQHMLRVVSLVHRLTNAADFPAPRRATDADAVFRELDELLERTSVLTHRTGDYLAKLRME